jgi:hypothetical protein
MSYAASHVAPCFQADACAATTVTAAQLYALRAAYQALVARSFPHWFESVAQQLAEEQTAQQ